MLAGDVGMYGQTTYKQGIQGGYVRGVVYPGVYIGWYIARVCLPGWVYTGLWPILTPWWV